MYAYVNDPVNAFDLDGKKAWTLGDVVNVADNVSSGLGVAALFGCGFCGILSAVLSVGVGAYKLTYPCL
ncbi:hypothetical protein [Curtobacterium sp. HSID17257]|uniref:hypothetical protein n=1 Tax=Curtobacterium sp. HSID17257 TaxID=2419510 RepID=UPI000F893306|nr:hypothetical protein [Curtobacterium sp. HSID17257]